MLVRRFGLVWGIVISSILFGLWHILPSIGTHEQNPALGSVAGQGRRGNIIAVALSVVTTSIAGILFAALRLLSGSVLAPMRTRHCSAPVRRSTHRNGTVPSPNATGSPT